MKNLETRVKHSIQSPEYSTKLEKETTPTVGKERETQISGREDIEYLHQKVLRVDSYLQ